MIFTQSTIMFRALQLTSLSLPSFVVPPGHLPCAVRLGGGGGVRFSALRSVARGDPNGRTRNTQRRSTATTGSSWARAPELQKEGENVSRSAKFQI